MLINGKPKFGRVILAHGAGAGMESEFLAKMAFSLGQIGFEVIRFDFPYMVLAKEQEKHRPPDRMPKLIEAYLEVISDYYEPDVPLYVAGKSMGGRVASHLLDDERITAGFVFGYPFHPRGKPENLRVEHLYDLTKPLHIFQGTRDPMGSFDEVKGYNLPDSLSLYWLEDGDHDLKPRKVSGFTHEQHLSQVVSTIKKVVC